MPYSQHKHACPLPAADDRVASAVWLTGAALTAAACLVLFGGIVGFVGRLLWLPLSSQLSALN